MSMTTQGRLVATRLDEAAGRWVRDRRRAARLTQSDLAGHLGVSYQQIQKYESGANRMSVGTFLAIAEVLHQPLSRAFAAVSASAIEDES
ncbi:MAG: helix-turn-helix transcriptional regulator [Planctomycetota bacterium]